MNARTIFAIACLCVAGAVLTAQGPALQPQPINLPSAKFPIDPTVIQGWVDKHDDAAQAQHAWDLWSGLTSITTDSRGWPVFETWYTDSEVSAGPTAGADGVARSRAGGRPVHTFLSFRQFHHRTLRGRSPLGVNTIAEQVVGFNKFNVPYTQHVWNNQYQRPDTIWKVQASWPSGTPDEKRTIARFTPQSIGLKPVFMVVNGPRSQSGLTVLPYWKGDLETGPSNSTNPNAPVPSTWKQCVVVYTGSTPPAKSALASMGCDPLVNGQSIAPSGVVPVSDFYHFELDESEVRSICQSQGQVNKEDCAVQPGDYAVLVAMHVSTDEVPEWTWQTFWWNYNGAVPQRFPPPSTIAAPFNHYASCRAYAMAYPNSASGKNILCYNPYLEPGLSDVLGVNSNCMSCHVTAGVGNNSNNRLSTVGPTEPNYPAFGRNSHNYISVTNPASRTQYFNCNTRTDFSWYLADLVGSIASPITQPPCGGTTTAPAGAK